MSRSQIIYNRCYVTRTTHGVDIPHSGYWGKRNEVADRFPNANGNDGFSEVIRRLSDID
jgi:hypothetical protein